MRRSSAPRSARGKRGTAAQTKIKPKSTAIGAKKSKLQARIRSLEEKVSQLKRQRALWDKKHSEHYEECRRKGIYNAVTYGIIGDFDELNKIKEPAKRQLALRHIARHNEINRKRGEIQNKIFPYEHELYYLRQELKKL